MKGRIILILTIALSAVSSVFAEVVPQKQAMQLAQNFFNTMYGTVTGRPKLVWNGRELTTNRLFTPFYTYNSPKGGYVTISADSKAYPVLSYSKTNIFDKARLGDDERDQFQRYAREIELIRYDSRIPTAAKDAWENIPKYFTDVINNPYATVEFRRLTDDARDRLETIDRRNAWVMMPTAVEFDLYDPEQYRDYTLDDVLMAEEVPFQFYEDFLAEMAEEERSKAAAYDRILTPDDAILQRSGGSHYTVLLPDEAAMSQVFSVDGMRMQRKTYRGTNRMEIDLSGMASGYYIILAMSQNGDIYAFKVYR